LASPGRAEVTAGERQSKEFGIMTLASLVLEAVVTVSFGVVALQPEAPTSSSTSIEIYLADQRSGVLRCASNEGPTFVWSPAARASADAARSPDPVGLVFRCSSQGEQILVRVDEIWRNVGPSNAEPFPCDQLPPDGRRAACRQTAWQIRQGEEVRIPGRQVSATWYSQLFGEELEIRVQAHESSGK
jgi:hypothetical protein